MQRNSIIMIKVLICGDTTPTDYTSMCTGTTDVTVINDNYNDNTVYTYSLYNYKIEFDYTAFWLEELREEIRTGWNNPRKINLRPKPFINNIRKVYRSALPYKMRPHSYVA